MAGARRLRRFSLPSFRRRSGVNAALRGIFKTRSETLGAAGVDLWHVAAAVLLEVDTFWTFDADQYKLAKAVRKFSHVPQLS